MAMRHRLAWLALLLAVQSLYFPINRTVHGGAVVALPLDAWVPLWPVWVVPYLLSLLWWLASYLWAAWRMDAALFQAFVLSLMLVALVSYVIYVAWPTYVVRPTVAGGSWASHVVAWLYANDRVNNAFPSGHTYTSVLIALYWARWRPRQRWLWAAVAAVVLLSTLFTRQHNLPDLLSGALLAWLGYAVGLCLAGVTRPNDGSW